MESVRGGRYATNICSIVAGGIPKGLAEMTPGPVLAGFLASIDRHSLSGHDRVLLMRAQRRQAAHYEAEAYASMVAVAESTAEELDGLPPESVEDSAAAEIGAALTLTRRSAETQLGFATTLVEDYPALWTALKEGALDVPRVMVIVNQTSHLESELRIPDHRPDPGDRPRPHYRSTPGPACPPGDQRRPRLRQETLRNWSRRTEGDHGRQ